MRPTTAAATGHSLAWFKSSYSGGAGSECLETAFAPDGTAVRDSKDPDGFILTFPGNAWSAFVRAVRRGESLR